MTNTKKQLIAAISLGILSAFASGCTGQGFQQQASDSNHSSGGGSETPTTTTTSTTAMTTTTTISVTTTTSSTTTTVPSTTTTSTTSTTTSTSSTTTTTVPSGNGSISATHPRLLLDASTLSRLRANATANTTSWQNLKSYCDSYVGGSTNYPDGNGYPNAPVVGQGYEGTGYFPIVLAEGLCYQVLKNSNPTLANTYGDKVVQILMAMTQPYPGTHGANPAMDDGYAIRFYGQSFGFGYDWAYDRLTSAQKSQIYSVANNWISTFETNSAIAFEYNHPQSNYFAGYFAAKAAIAIATYGDNSTATTQWSDWLNNQYATRVQPYYALHLAGGGWPEGFGNYGPNATLNMCSPAWMVKSATGTDLVHAATSYNYPIDIADYVMHFTWPSRSYIDDRDTNHANGSTTSPVGTADASMFQNILAQLRYWSAPHANIFAQYLQDVATATSDNLVCSQSGTEGNTCWSNFLFDDLGGATSAVSGLPLSYLASGMGAVAARSDWTTSASWMSFRAGPYVNNPNQGEEGFDQGSIAIVRGQTPLLVNATGWLSHEPNGSADEDLWYNDLYGSFSASNVYSGNREPYNVFYVRHMSGSNLAESFGQAAYTTENQSVRTTVSSFEDGTSYVYLLATHLEDMYRTFSAGAAVSAWAREVVYVRPNQFVVFDRTTMGSSSYDQYLAFHFPANPASGTAPSGETRLNVTYNSAFAGAMTVVLPTNATTTTTGLYPTSATTKVWQVQIRPASAGVTQNWLTVFDTSTSSSSVATASNIAVTQGNIVGTFLSSSTTNTAVIFSTGTAGTPLTGTLSYTVPNVSARHIITELSPNTNYNVSVAVSGGNKVVTITTGSGYTSSAKGVLTFTN